MEIEQKLSQQEFSALCHQIDGDAQLLQDSVLEGISLWPALRVQLSWLTHGTLNPKLGGAKKQQSWLQNLRNFARAPLAGKVWLISGEALYRTRTDEGLRHDYFAELAWQEPENFVEVFEAQPSAEFYQENGLARATPQPFFALNFLKQLAKALAKLDRLPLFFGRSKKAALQRFVVEVAQGFGFKQEATEEPKGERKEDWGNANLRSLLSEQGVVRFASIFRWQRRVFTWALRWKKPQKLVFTTHDRHLALIAAAKKLGIECVELQHGFISQDHYYYNYLRSAEELAKQGIELPLPQQFYFFGEFWKKKMQGKGYWPREQDVFVGPYTINYHRGLEVEKDPKQILLTVSNFQDQAMIAQVLEFMRERPEYTMLIRPHPLYDMSELEDWALEQNSQFEKPRIFLNRFSETKESTMALIQRSFCHVSIGSTCHADALALGTATFIFSANAYFAGYWTDLPEYSASAYLFAKAEEFAAGMADLESKGGKVDPEEGFLFYESAQKQSLRELLLA